MDKMLSDLKNLKFYCRQKFDNDTCVFIVGGKQKWVPMDIEHKSGRSRRSRSAGRSRPSSGISDKVLDKTSRPERPERGRFGMNNILLLSLISFPYQTSPERAI